MTLPQRVHDWTDPWPLQGQWFLCVCVWFCVVLGWEPPWVVSQSLSLRWCPIFLSVVGLWRPGVGSRGLRAELLLYTASELEREAKIKVLRCIKSVRMLRWKWMKCKPFNAMSMGIFGNVELTISWRSNSFSSTKWSSLPPPLANLKGMLSPVWKPYRGYKGNQEINKH